MKRNSPILGMPFKSAQRHGENKDLEASLDLLESSTNAVTDVEITDEYVLDMETFTNFYVFRISKAFGVTPTLSLPKITFGQPLQRQFCVVNKTAREVIVSDEDQQITVGPGENGFFLVSKDDLIPLSNLSGAQEILNSPSFGWAVHSGGIRTSVSPLNLDKDTRTVLTLDGQNGVNRSELNTVFDGHDFLDQFSKFRPFSVGDAYTIRIGFTYKPLEIDAALLIELDIGGAVGVIWSDNKKPGVAAGDESHIICSIDAYCLQTFYDNGGNIYVTSDSISEIYDISTVVFPEHIG